MLLKINGNLSVLVSSNLSSNTIFIPMNNETLLIFDIGLPNTLQKVYDTIKTHFPRYSYFIIVATHEHYDHIGGIAQFCKLFRNCQVFSSHHTKQVLENGDSYTSVAYLYGEKLTPTTVHRVLKNKDILNTQLGPFSVIETPGHTVGSLCFYNSKMKLLISGDTVFPNGNFGRFDLPTGNIHHLLTSIKLLTQLPTEILIAGHGRVIKQGAHRHIKQAYTTLKSLVNEI